MSNIHSLPDLPVELQGSILQFIALVSPGNYRIQLMLLSKVVYDWSVPPFLTWVASLVQSQPTVFRVSYIQYDTVIIKDPKSFQSFLKVIESRDIAFLSARMRALFIKVYDDATLPLWTVLWKNILPYLSEMQYLEIWDPFLHYSTEELQPVRSAVVPVLQLLPRLSYLGIHPHFFWRSSEISYVVLHSITHLKIFDTGTSLSSILSSLNSFPSLTHFMFPLEELETSETALELAYNLTRLKAIVIGKSRYQTDSSLGSLHNVVIRDIDDIFKDSDLVCFEEVVGKDKRNVWRLAELDIALRREAGRTS